MDRTSRGYLVQPCEYFDTTVSLPNSGIKSVLQSIIKLVFKSFARMFQKQHSGNGVFHPSGWLTMKKSKRVKLDKADISGTIYHENFSEIN